MPFSVINDINVGRETESIEKYNAFLTNRFFSFFSDTLYFANLMNMNYDLDPKYQFRFYRSAVRPSKRWQKWLKKESSDKYDVIRKHYGFSDKKTKEALTILSDEQIAKIAALYET